MDWKLFGSTFLAIFLAEMGDKTQLATLSFASSGSSRWTVFAASAAALVATSAIAVMAGRRSRGTSAGVDPAGREALFVVLGVWTLVKANASEMSGRREALQRGAHGPVAPKKRGMDNGALPIVVAALFVLGVVGFAAGVLLDVRALRLVAKPIPVLALAALAGASEGRYARILAAGLALGAVGDVLLEIGPRLFVAGLGAFLIGHVAYVVAFVVEERRARICVRFRHFCSGWGCSRSSGRGSGGGKTSGDGVHACHLRDGVSGGGDGGPGRKGRGSRWGVRCCSWRVTRCSGSIGFTRRSRRGGCSSWRRTGWLNC
ncbi:MAG: TMEM165/GDT1 family protein [Polyangiaceae bacterium]